MKKFLALAATSLLVLSTPALAGPFIIDGTDADDHGSASGGVNLDGWLYIQKGLENIAAGAGLTRTQKTIAVLGSNSGSQAALAVQSAVSLSSALSGWTVVLLNESQITDFFNNTGGGLLSTGASVLYMDSASNVTGGLNSGEQAIINSNATNINDFVGSGGGLFSHSQGYGWLSALIPGLTIGGTTGQGEGISLTPAGNLAFPGLTNADLSAGPYHNTFLNTGAVPVLGIENSAGSSSRAVILGGGGGSITNPTPPPTNGAVPEPSTWLSMLAGFGVMGFAMRRGTRATQVRFAI